jgi:hypothetical protein
LQNITTYLGIYYLRRRNDAEEKKRIDITKSFPVHMIPILYLALDTSIENLFFSFSISTYNMIYNITSYILHTSVIVDMPQPYMRANSLRLHGRKRLYAPFLVSYASLIMGALLPLVANWPQLYAAMIICSIQRRFRLAR